MALNPEVERKTDIECLKTGELDLESCDSKTNSLSAAISATSNQNGDQTGCEDGVMPEQEASERRRSGQTAARSSDNSPLPGQRQAEELPRRNFQIPRKIKERKGLYQFLAPDSREFEGLVKILSSFYLDASSRGTFSYCKARLIHNELLEKEFIEKRRELKQEGRTDPELVESYCFLFPDKSKLPWICEKGLSVGHSRITTLGNPAMGVYLSKFSDLLQMNPFEAGSCGDIVIFKVMRGRLKSIFENMPKSVLDPTPKFDCHISKNATRVTSLLSYRAFELTQQYFYEFAFDEIKPRPRHVCPYAVVSFQYKGKESAAAPMAAHRFNSAVCEGGSKGRSSYTVWSGPLVNKGQELCQVSLRSSTRHFLPFKLTEKLEMSMGMQLDQVKRKIPSVLFSWDTYSRTREVLKCGIYCSLFEVVDGKGKATSSTLSGLIHKLERERMVLVKPLVDKGFLFLLSSTQMFNPNERRGRVEKSLQALFVFQESRGVTKFTPRLSEQEPLSAEPLPPLLASMDPFIPALHYALLKMRSTPDNKHLSTVVERQALDYLTRRDSGRAFLLPEYQQNLDERGNVQPAPRPKSNMEGLLRSYLHGLSSAYVLPIVKARDMMDRINQPPPAPAPTVPDYSPVSDWGGSGGSDRPERVERQPLERPESSRRRGGPSQTHSNGAAAGTGAPPQRSRLAQSEYDKDKMKELLKLIQLHKALVKEPGGKERAEGGDEGAWEGPHGLKRKLEEDESGAMSKYLRGAHFSNGEPSRAQGEEVENYNLAAVMESMGIYDTDLRDRGNTSQASSANETQRLLKILLSTLNKAMVQGAAAGPTDLPDHVEPSTENPLTGAPIEGRVEQARQDFFEEQTVCSLTSPFSADSPGQQPHTSDNPSLTWELASHTDKPIPFFESQNDGNFEQRGGLEGGERGLRGASVEQERVTKEASIERGAKGASLEREMALRGAFLEGGARDTSLEGESKVEKPARGVSLERVARPSSSLDTIVSQELHCLSNSIQGLMDNQKIYYNSQLPQRLSPRHAWQPNSSFSDFVAPYVVSVPVQGHVNTLCERMGRLVPKPRHTDSAKTPGARSTLHVPSATTHPIPSFPHPPHSLSSIPPLPSMHHLPPPPALVHSPAPVLITSPTAKPVPKTKAQAPQAKSSSSSQNRPKHVPFKQTHKNPSAAQKPSTERKSEPSASKREVYSPAQASMDSSDSTPKRPKQDAITAPSPLTPASAAGLLMGQLKPEVFSSLVEIFKDVQRNTVRFYIHSGEEEESDICVEIKEYLLSLGNTECNPQMFLENNSSLDKLLIVIQNEDISAHVNKIPALVSLKKLSTVSFAGVDSLDDVKNHTYNELFVSGGFIVSDEFVLNPDFITHDRLQAFLRFLEEQSSPENPWQWKIHNKSQKKLKELGRLNNDAMALLNLLTAYQKKHLVEFLPYHECDAQSRQAPDLDCLVKLQANHTQHRHFIFLTERRFEMFMQYSRNGIVIASIDDIMTSFHSLIGSRGQKQLPTPPSTVVHDECIEEEDMSLDSDDDSHNQVIVEHPAQSQEGVAAAGMGDSTQQPPLPESDEFRPPLPDQLNTPGRHTPSSISYSSRTPNLSNFAALKSAISQFKASNQIARADIGSTSPGGFSVNPHQSFLCPSTQWVSYSGSSGYTASPAYPASPCSTTQEQDYRNPAAVPTTAPGSTLTSQAPLTLPDIPQPPPLPPHLKMGGILSQSFSLPGSVSGAAGVGVGASISTVSSTSTLPITAIVASSSSLSTALTYSDPTVATTASLGLDYSQSDMVQLGYPAAVSSSANGTPTQQGDRRLSGPGESPWGLGGGTPNSQGGARPGSVSHSGLTQGGERERTGTPGGSTPGSQGGRTPVNSVESLGAGMAVPSVATRGGSIARPMLPIHGTGGSRGGEASVQPLSGGGYGCLGAMPGQMGMGRGGMGRGGMGPWSLGGYRGRGAPQRGPWPRPGVGPERPDGGGPCGPSWGYPKGRGGGQDYYSDYTYSHNYSP
ncbi:protein TASOR isoform X2 [Oncorhynchus mykiss]|uniref:protein TASOR isoform X2 n=1 Tax=Oncorhynchus mykiss TaxID=8022 RepID=UPI0018788FB0|nr:protein TASOR isoform X2 [Oncorhynchus mykiss]